MTKTMRKYQKWLLAILGSLLMVTFLVQGTMSGRGGPSDRSYAKVNGRTIMESDRIRVVGRYHAIREVLPGVYENFGVSDEDHWLLLVEEAKSGGFIGHAGDGENFIPDLCTLYADMVIRRDIRLQIQIMQDQSLAARIVKQFEDRLANRGAPEGLIGHSTHESFLLGLAELRGVLRMLVMDSSAPRLSDRAARLALSTQESSLVVDALVLDASLFGSTVPAPGEAELAAQFEKYKDVDPGTGDDGFGYTLPPRVRLEWLTLDRAAMKSAVKLDPVDVNKRYLQDRTKYPGEFGVERVKIESEMMDSAVDKLMVEADRAVRAQVSIALQGLPEDGSFRKLPPDWNVKAPKLGDIARKVVETVRTATGSSIPEPRVESREEFLTSEKIQALPNIGASIARLGATQIPLAQYVFQVRELGPAQEQPGFQVGVPLVGVPMTNFAGDKFFINVLAARKKSAADSIAEVKDKVEKDVRTLHAFEALKARLEEFKGLAASSGLDAVAKKAVENTTVAVPSVRQRVNVPKDSKLRPDLDFSSKELHDAVWAVGETLDPLVDYKADTLAQRTVAAAIPAKHKVVIGQILKRQPLTVESLRRLQPNRLTAIQQNELSELFPTRPNSAYSFEALKSRLGFEPVQSSEKKKQQS